MGLAARAAHDVAATLRFFTRLPIPGAEYAPPDWPAIAWAAPVAGGLVGAIGAIGLGVGYALALPANLDALLAVAAMCVATGALHEDGLADVADGFGGGATREAKLAIMRDSRIGAFGAMALILATLLRVGALAALLRLGPGMAIGGLILAGALARAGALAPLALLAPARADGAGARAGALPGSALRSALVSAAVVAVLTGLLALGFWRALFAGVLAGAAAWGVCALARRQIGGQTGDVAGAAAQITEVVALCALLIGGR